MRDWRDVSRPTLWKVAGVVTTVVAAGVVVGVVVSGGSGGRGGSSGAPPAVVPNPGSTTVSTDGSLTCTAGKTSTVTSWVGNTFGGANDIWIQPGIQGLYVAKDGTAYGESIFNEGARELRGYRNGTPFGGYVYQHANDLPNGGVAVTGDADHVYAAVRFGNSSGVMRYNAGDLTPAPFAGGTAPQGATLVVSKTYEYLTALAAGGGKLYVADPTSYVSQTSTAPSETTVVRVYDTADLGSGQVASFAAPRARGLAVDGDGDLWVLQQADSSHPAQIARYAPDGTPTGAVVTGVASPTAIAVDTSGGGVGRLLVTDDGPDQDIKIFGGLDGTPSLAQTFGTKGGVQAGPVPGTVGPGRLNGPAAVGVDASGDIYVVSNGVPKFSVQGYGEGNDLQAYTSSGTLKWEVYGQKYNTTDAGLDQSTGVDLYGAFDHYQLDLSKPVGQQWVRVGWTYDPQKYPHDPRVDGQGEGQLPTVPTVRTLDGHTFLFMGNGMADALQIFRFDKGSQIAIPSGSIDTYQAKASPAPGEFVWRDVNGDGDPFGNVAAEYFQPQGAQNVDVTGWYVDTAGDVWQTTTSHGIREFLFQGLDAVGNPVYDYQHLRTFATPAPFTDPRRLVYDPASDTLVVSGYTAASPAPTTNDHDYKFAGTVLASYAGFTKDPTATASWTANLPYAQIASDAAHKTITLSAAGSYVFVGYFTGPDNQFNTEVRIYDARTGAQAGVLSPGASVGGRIGNVDMEDGTAAYQTKGGGYLVFDEDDVFDKTLMWEWCPP